MTDLVFLTAVNLVFGMRTRSKRKRSFSVVGYRLVFASKVSVVILSINTTTETLPLMKRVTVNARVTVTVSDSERQCQ